MVIRARNGAAAASFFDDKDLANEHFTDIWTGWNDFDRIQLYEYHGYYQLIKDVKKEGNL